MARVIDTIEHPPLSGEVPFGYLLETVHVGSGQTCNESFHRLKAGERIPPQQSPMPAGDKLRGTFYLRTTLLFARAPGAKLA